MIYLSSQIKQSHNSLVFQSLSDPKTQGDLPLLEVRKKLKEQQLLAV